MEGDFEKIRQGSRTLYIRRQFLNNSLGQALLSGEEKLRERYNLKMVPSSEFARVYRFHVSVDGVEREVYLKQFLSRGSLEFIKCFFRGSRAKRALEAELMLAKNHFDAPETLAIGEHQSTRSFSATFGIEGSKSVSRFICEWPKEEYKARRELIRAFGRTIGRMHANNIFHGDLRLNNVLVRQKNGEWRFFFLDNERTKQFGKLSFRRRVKNLVQVNMVPPGVLSNTDRLRFFREYCAATGIGEEEGKILTAATVKKTRRRLDKKKRTSRQQKNAADQGRAKGMKLSVIIVSWNVQDDLAACLRSLYENRPQADFETIVVDNASSDGTIEAIERNFPNVKAIANTTNAGFAAANNKGIQKAGGQYIFLLNPDTIVHKSALDTLIGFMDNNPDVGACGPKLLNNDGTTQPSLRRFPTFRGALYRHTILRHLGIFRKSYNNWMMKDFSYNKQADVEQLMGSAMLVRHSAIEQVGLMDERFFMYYEEVDFCYRLKEAGRRIVFVPEATITHLGGHSAEQVPAERRAMMFTSMLAFFRKHRSGFQTTLFNVVFKTGVALAEVHKLAAGLIAYLCALALGNKERRNKSLDRIRSSLAWLVGIGRRRKRKPL